MFEAIYFGIGIVIAGFMWFSHMKSDCREYLRPGDDAAAFIISIMMIFAWGLLLPFALVMGTWDWASDRWGRRK